MPTTEDGAAGPPRGGGNDGSDDDDAAPGGGGGGGASSPPPASFQSFSLFDMLDAQKAKASSSSSVPAAAEGAAEAVPESSSSAAGTGTGAAASFSLFDLLDSQPGGPAAAVVGRVAADDVLKLYRECSGGGGACAGSKLVELADLLGRVDDLEDLTYDPFGTSGGGGGDVWPDVNDALRFGLGLLEGTISSSAAAVPVAVGAASSANSSAAEPSEDEVIERFADVHAHLGNLIGPNRSVEFARQSLDLVVNVIDGMVALAAAERRPKSSLSPSSFPPTGRGRGGWWCRVDTHGRVTVSPSAAALVRTFHSLIPGAVSSLGSVPDGDADAYLEKMMGLLSIATAAADGTPTTATAAKGRTTNDGIKISPAHLIAAVDPYAHWFVRASRSVPPVRLVGAAVRSGMLRDVVAGLCLRPPGSGGSPSGPGPTADGGGDAEMEEAEAAAGTDDGDGDGDAFFVAVGSTSDLEHCLYLQSLSVVRSLLVATAGCWTMFPYRMAAAGLCAIGDTADGSVGGGVGVGVDSGSGSGSGGGFAPPSAADVAAVLTPFRSVLAVGVAGGAPVVGEELAHLCGEAAEAALRGGTAAPPGGRSGGGGRRWGGGAAASFAEVFSGFVGSVVGEILGRPGGSGVGGRDDRGGGGDRDSGWEVPPAAVAFFRVCRVALETSPWTASARGRSGSDRTDAAASCGSARDAILSSVGRLVEASAAVFSRLSDRAAAGADASLTEAADPNVARKWSDVVLVLEPILDSGALLAACKREDIVDTIRRYRAVAEKAGASSELTRVLLRLAATPDGVRVLEELGLIEECMELAAALAFGDDSACEGPPSETLRMYYSRTGPMLVTRVGFEAFVWSGAVAELRSHVVDVASNCSAVADPEVGSLLIAIYGSRWVRTALEEDGSELGALLHDLAGLVPKAPASSRQVLVGALGAAYANGDAKPFIERDSALSNQMKSLFPGQ